MQHVFNSGVRSVLVVLIIGGISNADGMVFPGEHWKQATPESQGIDAQLLTGAVEYLKAHSGRDGVRELIIVRNGRLIWQGDRVDKQHNVWSCTKSFTSTVLGLLIDDGKCMIDTPAARFVPGMAEHYGDVTLRHLASMTSGYQAVGDDPETSHGQSGTPFRPSSRPLFTPPGSHFAYWDSAQNQFALALTQIAGEPIAELFRRRLADSIGMNSQQWNWGDFGAKDGVKVNGGAGNKGKGISISARELARFGHLMLNRGRWRDRQLLSEDWVRQATSVQVPASLPLGHGEQGPGCYGFNWWVNGEGPDGRRKWPEAPPDTFSASGHNNNRCFVIPPWNMVIVRLGLDQADGRISDATWSRFLGLVGQSLEDGREERCCAQE